MSMTSARLTASERREQLLGVALKVFAHKGFHNSSMNDVADAAGVTKPVLYQHFDSKRALFAAALEAVGEKMIDAIHAATQGAASGREKTTAGMVAYFQWVMDDPDAFMLLFGSGTRRDEGGIRYAGAHTCARLNEDLVLAGHQFLDGFRRCGDAGLAGPRLGRHSDLHA